MSDQPDQPDRTTRRRRDNGRPLHRLDPQERAWRPRALVGQRVEVGVDRLRNGNVGIHTGRLLAVAYGPTGWGAVVTDLDGDPAGGCVFLSLATVTSIDVGGIEYGETVEHYEARKAAAL